MPPPPTIYSLGDSAITIELGTDINTEANDRAIALQQWLFQHPFDGMLELVLAYSSLTVYYDPFLIKKTFQPAGPVCRWVEERLRVAIQKTPQVIHAGKLHRIPVCYSGTWAGDLEQLSKSKHLSPREIIDIHANRRYRVYMIGFIPGFAYMGKVDQRIATPRKSKPTIVAAGSVAIAGEQTGIYPFESPGGWNVIGRTPLTLFNPNADEPVWLKPGDEVEFFAIDESEFDSHY